MRRGWTGLLLAVAMTAATVTPAVADVQDDAGSGGDAGNGFEIATAISPSGFYAGRLDAGAGDRHDFYRFYLPESGSVSVLVGLPLGPTDPVVLLDPSGTPVDAGVKVERAGLSASAIPSRELVRVRLAVHRAVVAGEYRLHLSAEQFPLGDYTLCFWNCETPRAAPIDLIFGGSLVSPHARVLLIPPSHGDLGNPLGPTVLDYIDATLRGVRRWTAAMTAFAGDFPEYGYLRDITVHVEVFDGADPVDPAGYDVVIGYVAAGPVFRGVASGGGSTDPLFRPFGLADDVRFGGRSIALSLFGSSPRAGQVLYDFPEPNDLEIVTMHEFGHTFGVGHTTTWDPALGPDVMNSPAPFIYGDGFPAGDGGERTAMKCLSSLDLYAMAVLYRWLPSGAWQPSGGRVALPGHIPYRWYCP